ncbi:MAG: hypothetical protein L3K10_06855 [Thermoplasmata archaeon]|nr:hypothetical protein [Thermoplasmata archaeon]
MVASTPDPSGNLAGPPSSADSPPPSRPAPAPGRRPRHFLLPVVVVVVAIVVVIGVLAASGVLFRSSQVSTTEAYSTLSEAESVAGPAASHASSGSWSTVVAVAIRTSIGISLPLLALPSVSNLTSGCNLTSLPGAPASVSIDTTPTSALGGHAAFWLLILSDGRTGLLAVSVDLGAPSALFSVTGTGCVSSSSMLVPFPSSAGDSPSIVAAANSSGGAAFLGQHPTATQLWAGVGGVSVGSLVKTSPIWAVIYTSCPVPYPINETGADFNATLVGASVLSSSAGPVNCAAGLGSFFPVPPTGLGLLAGVAKAI